MRTRRSSSNDSTVQHPYVVFGKHKYGTDQWKKSKILRNKKTGEVTINIIDVQV